MKQIVLDFETASNCDLKKAGAWRYAEDPTTEILCLAFEYEGIEECWLPNHRTAEGDLLELANNPEVIFVTHNAGFEKAIWRRIMVPDYHFPDIPNSRWADTMAVAAMKALPQDLDGLVRALRLPAVKDLAGSALTRNMSKAHKKTGRLDRSAETLARVYSYCEQDVRAERGVLDRLGDLPPPERNVWLLDQRINERGVRLDMPFVYACQRIVDDASEPLAKEFEDITGGLGFGQVAKVKKWLQDLNVWLPDLRKETVAQALGSDPDFGIEDWEDPFPMPPQAQRALSIRQLVGSASVKKLASMDACVCSDGRAHGLLQYHGAGPGRWAGRILQPQNFPRPTLKDESKKPVPVEAIVGALMTGDYEYVEATIGPAVEAVISGLRHALIPAPGRTFLSGDFSQVEARIVLALAGQHDKVQLFVTGKPYIDMAEQIYRRKISKENDLQEYTIGKSAVLGCGFQMGGPKFKARYSPKNSLEFAENVVRVYRKEWAPLVPFVWAELQEAAVRTAWDKTPHEAYGVLYQLEDGWMTARLPSGRKLWYWNPQPIRRAMPWDETDIRPAWTYQAMKMGQFKTIDAFGGLLTENVVQGLARDLLVAAMFRLEKNGFPLVLTVHDEALAEPLEKDVDEKAFEQIMCEPTSWSKQLQIPVAVETWSGERYRK